MAEKVELKPYPFPEGIAIPRLMPYQEFPWNGDGYLAAEVLRLRHAHHLTCAMETGTCLGSTTLWLAENFEEVTSCEIHVPYMDIARARIKADNVKLRQGKSVGFVPDALTWFGDQKVFCFLDAHWSDHCPLLDELEAIASAGVKPVILIHDFSVPGTDFGFDKMPDGRPFNLDLIREHLDLIYGRGDGLYVKWKYNYPTQVEGARRGWISIEPCQ